jgi:histidinol dehydrogenase
MIPMYRGAEAAAWLDRSCTPSHAVDDAAGKIERAVKDILEQVRDEGDAALAKIASKFGDAAPVRLRSEEIATGAAQLPSASRSTIEFAAKRIEAFAAAVMQSLNPVVLEYAEYAAGMDLVPVQRAACYVPGGRYPLPSTALMTAVTACVAGVPHIAIFTPSLKPEILYAALLAGVNEVYQIGGAQAVAAAAFGTQTIKPFDLIVGPGNAYVTEAKRQVQGRIGIDMLAGPSEIAVIADGGSNPQWVCFDLLSQAEHDVDARAYLLTDSAELADAVVQALPEAIKRSGAPSFVSESLAESAVLVFDSMDDCIKAANGIAPEHLLLHVANPEDIKSRLRNYGALFMGYHSTVPYGDYCAGPNHTLPTNRAARFVGGLNPLSFLRAQTWLAVKQPAPELAQRTAEFARLEGLNAHAAAAIARLGAATKA